ncbi:MAG TPA: PD-(D/E)XK nuclease family protein [Planctomycetota bacterium]|nr:PD-(D/E)XK nuclease family protein [Planctomycetota bacterium]
MTTALEVAAPSHVRGAATTPDHLSWSALRTFAACGKRYFWKYVEPVAEEMKPASLIFGGAIHSSLEFLCQSRLNNGPVPELDDILQTYDAAWIRETANAPEVRFAKEENETTLRALASRMLSVFREFAINEATLPDPASVVGIEESVRFRLFQDTSVPPFEARIDLIEVHNDDLIITDFKTSRSRWNPTTEKDHVGQILLYSIALVPLLRELDCKRLIPRFVVISKAKTPVVQVLEPVATQDDVVRLKEMVMESWKAISSGIFVKNEGWHCQSCPFRQRCLGR